MFIEILSEEADDRMPTAKQSQPKPATPAPKARAAPMATPIATPSSSKSVVDVQEVQIEVVPPNAHVVPMQDEARLARVMEVAQRVCGVAQPGGALA